jgi:hypothetical protein
LRIAAKRNVARLVMMSSHGRCPTALSFDFLFAVRRGHSSLSTEAGAAAV